MDWIWTKCSFLCFKIQNREGDNHFTPPPNQPSPCNDGLCSREYISQLCSHARLVWQAFWCFGAIWITPEADGLLTYGAVIKPSWKRGASGKQGWALEGPGWCFFDYVFFQRPCLSFLPKKVGITWITALNLVKMLCQDRFVFFCECCRQYLKELTWGLVMKTAVWRAHCSSLSRLIFIGLKGRWWRTIKPKVTHTRRRVIQNLQQMTVAKFWWCKRYFPIPESELCIKFSLLLPSTIWKIHCSHYMGQNWIVTKW